MMNRNEKIVTWFQNETEKDEKELDKIKKDFVDYMKKVDKEEIFEKEKKPKMSLWHRMKKVLMGI